MGVLIRKQKGVALLTGMGKLSIVGFLVSFTAAIISAVWAIYIDSFVHSMMIVGLITSALAAVSFLLYFLFIPIIQKNSKSKLFSFSLLAFAVAYILFAINRNFYIFLFLALFSTMLSTFKITCFGIIVKDKSNKKKLTRNEGLVYTFLNIAWFIGPLLAGYIADKYNINLVFALAAIFTFIGFLFFKRSRVRNKNIKKRADTNVVKNFKEFFKTKERRLAYILGGAVNLWWVFIDVFIPLLIIRSGLGEIWVGYFLSAAIFPLILFEYSFAKLAGKIGFKKVFALGFLIPAVIAVICFFITNIYAILGLLVLASMGLAMTEPTTESYFFDILKGKQELRFYGPYNTTISVNHFIGLGLSALLLSILPFKYMFLLFAFFMFIMVILSFKVRKIIEDKK